MGNSQLAQRTHLPPSTVSRIAQTLVRLGYVQHDGEGSRYRLAAWVLGLGCAAITQSVAHRHARHHMLAFAKQHRMHVSLATRDRLDLLVLATQRSQGTPLSMGLSAGMRISMPSSPMGWSLLVVLPELERQYLLENIEQHAPLELARFRRRMGVGIAHVNNLGYCAAIGESDLDIGILAAPLLVGGQSPFVLVCVGACARLSRTVIERELGPHLMAMARSIRPEIDENSA